MASRTKRTRSATTEINPIAPAGAWDPQDPAHGVAAAAVVNMVLRVAGPVLTRVDLRNAGTPERQQGISLGCGAGVPAVALHCFVDRTGVVAGRAAGIVAAAGAADRGRADDVGDLRRRVLDLVAAWLAYRCPYSAR